MPLGQSLTVFCVSFIQIVKWRQTTCNSACVLSFFPPAPFDVVHLWSFSWIYLFCFFNSVNFHVFHFYIILFTSIDMFHVIQDLMFPIFWPWNINKPSLGKENIFLISVSTHLIYFNYMWLHNYDRTGVKARSILLW